MVNSLSINYSAKGIGFKKKWIVIYSAIDLSYMMANRGL